MSIHFTNALKILSEVLAKMAADSENKHLGSLTRVSELMDLGMTTLNSVAENSDGSVQKAALEAQAVAPVLEASVAAVEAAVTPEEAAPAAVEPSAPATGETPA